MLQLYIARIINTETVLVKCHPKKIFWKLRKIEKDSQSLLGRQRFQNLEDDQNKKEVLSKSHFGLDVLPGLSLQFVQTPSF